MKHTITLLLSIAFFTSIAQNDPTADTWTTSGSVTSTNDKVGIGTTTFTGSDKFIVANGDILLDSRDGLDNDADLNLKGDGGRQLSIWLEDYASQNIAYIQATSPGTKLAFGAGGWNTRMTLLPTGQLGIGTQSIPSEYLLGVKGKIICEELTVEAHSGWFPDYVFDASYELKSLEEIESFILQEKHLPGVPSADDVAKNGLSIAAMQKIQMEKIEELTLHMIALKKENDLLKAQVSTLID